MVGCSAYGCSRSSNKGFRCFTFPRDAKRRRIWALNCRRDKWKPTDSSRLCEAHFDDDQYEKRRADGWRKLSCNAIPTIFDFPDRPPKNTRKTSRAVPKISDDLVITVDTDDDDELMLSSVSSSATDDDQPGSSLTTANETSVTSSLLFLANAATAGDQPALAVPLPSRLSVSPQSSTQLLITGCVDELEDRCAPCEHFEELQSLRAENESLKQELAALKGRLTMFLDEEKQDAISLGKELVQSWTRGSTVDGVKIGFALGGRYLLDSSCIS